MKKLFEQIIKFGIVGGISFVVDFTIYTILANVIGTNILIAGFFGFTISVIVNYLLSMKFVFERRDDMSRTKEMVIFIGMSVIGLGINEVILYLCKEVLYNNWTAIHGIVTEKWANIGAKIIATGVVMVYNFVSRKLVLEKKPSASPTD